LVDTQKWGVTIREQGQAAYDFISQNTRLSEIRSRTLTTCMVDNCYYGLWPWTLSKFGFEVLGLDNLERIEIAKAIFPKINFSDKPPRKKFDVVWEVGYGNVSRIENLLLAHCKNGGLFYIFGFTDLTPKEIRGMFARLGKVKTRLGTWRGREVLVTEIEVPKPPPKPKIKRRRRKPKKEPVSDSETEKVLPLVSAEESPKSFETDPHL